MTPVKLLCLCSICVSACVPITRPVDNLRDISLGEVGGYAYSTADYIAKHGEDKAQTEILEHLKTRLKDGESAKFRATRMVTYGGNGTGRLMCGEVNAKNSYGGYTGFTRFVAGVNGASMYNADSKYAEVNSAYNAGLFAACGY